MLFWKLAIPIASLIGFAMSYQSRRETKARRLVEDALRFGRTEKEFLGAARIAKEFGWHKFARELTDKSKKLSA